MSRLYCCHCCQIFPFFSSCMLLKEKSCKKTQFSIWSVFFVTFLVLIETMLGVFSSERISSKLHIKSPRTDFRDLGKHLTLSYQSNLHPDFLSIIMLKYPNTRFVVRLPSGTSINKLINELVRSGF